MQCTNEKSIKLTFKQAKDDENPINSCWDNVLQRFYDEVLKYVDAAVDGGAVVVEILTLSQCSTEKIWHRHIVFL